MKNFYITVLILLLHSLINAQIVNIPDPNFKAKLLEASPTNYIASTINTLGNTSYPYVSIDTNGDGEIQVSEANAIQYLNISYSQIVNLEGINSFVNLKLLDCKYNQITNLNVTGIANLEYLYCPNNQINNLNVNGLQFLRILNCYFNQLTNLDVSTATNLRYLHCYENQLTNLNITGLTNLLYLYCYENQLINLNANGISSLRFLRCNNNPLQTLYIKTGNSSWSDLTFDNNPDLNYICSDPEDISLVQNKITQYGYTNCSVDSSCSLTTSSFDFSDNFTIYPNPVKNSLNITNNQSLAVSSICIYNVLGQLMLTITNPTDSIDVSSLKKGNYFIKILLYDRTASVKFIKE
jgi:Secretion system C-terminal sorting domain